MSATTGTFLRRHFFQSFQTEMIVAAISKLSLTEKLDDCKGDDCETLLRLSS
jgi:hypothetical protein